VTALIQSEPHGGTVETGRENTQDCWPFEIARIIRHSGAGQEAIALLESGIATLRDLLPDPEPDPRTSHEEMTKMATKHANFEGYPALYYDVETYEAYVLFGEAWTEMPIAEVMQFAAGPLSKSAFRRAFPRLPPLPKDAFKRR
jgi:hypothetical protein